MPQASCNGITLEYAVSGPSDGQPLLLIHGTGAQLIRWPAELLGALASAGFRVIVFDARDVGLSTHLRDAPVPDLSVVAVAQRKREAPDLAYSVSDLAADAAGLLDALGIARAHVLGVSLGGMVAQVLAIEHSARVASMTLLMSHAGNPDLPPPDPAATATLVARPPDPRADRGGYIRHSVALNRALGSPLYPTDEAVLRDLAQRAADRAYDPAGAARQLAASRGAPDRRAALRTLAVPTLAIHGTADPLIAPVGSEDIAANVAGAWLLRIDGMGHDLPVQLVALFVGAIAANAARAAVIIPAGKVVHAHRP